MARKQDITLDDISYIIYTANSDIWVAGFSIEDQCHVRINGYDTELYVGNINILSGTKINDLLYGKIDDLRNVIFFNIYEYLVGLDKLEKPKIEISKQWKSYIRIGKIKMLERK